MAKSPKNKIHYTDPVDTILIQSEESEEAWMECKNLGIFATWTGSREEMSFMSNWLEENCRGQVSISYFGENVLYLNCFDKSVRDEFIKVSECQFNGHTIKFIEWSPNFKLSDANFKCPIWFLIRSLPPELNQIETLKQIGDALGEFVGIEASFESDNNVKLLINTKFNHESTVLKKVKTKRAEYELTLHKYKDEISEIIKIEDHNGLSLQNLPLTSDFQISFPTIYRLRNKLGNHFANFESYSQPEDRNKVQPDFRLSKDGTQSKDIVEIEQRDKVKSIIVNKIVSGLGQDHGKVKKRKSKKKKNASKALTYRLESEEERKSIIKKDLDNEEQGQMAGKNKETTTDHLTKMDQAQEMDQRRET